ncbi:hypothetical protein [Pseudomonas sp. HS6]|uniref:hypothetical protein n=1 Tax=Pseudomonas sp. HS6 TaxID=2850559 RepID=UPI002019383D|nr:hypothetical protein [Pseudomonas sp. HS6]UQS12620.1 hypothetical protein JJN09_15410 [Pseudomonas sp. HS6]
MQDLYTVLMVGAAVLIVPETDDVTIYDDVINTVLYAQLVANKQTEKEPDTLWYDVYSDIIDGFWFRYEKSREDRTLAPDSDVCAVDWVVAAMSKVNADEGQAIAEVMARLEKISDTTPAIKMLRTHVQKVSEHVVMPVPAPAEDVHMMVIVAQSPTSFRSVYFELKTDQALGPSPLFQRYRAEDVKGAVTLRAFRANLVESQYVPVRHELALKIKSRIKDNVAVLEKGDPSCCAVLPERLGND